MVPGSHRRFEAIPEMLLIPGCAEDALGSFVTTEMPYHGITVCEFVVRKILSIGMPNDGSTFNWEPEMLRSAVSVTEVMPWEMWRRQLAVAVESLRFEEHAYDVEGDVVNSQHQDLCHGQVVKGSQ